MIKIALALMKKSLAILIIFFTQKTFAQIVSIDKFDTANYTNKAKWNCNILAGIEVDKQQQTLYDATNSLELSLQKKKNLFLLSSSYRFTYNGPDDILNTGYFHLRFRHNYKNKIQPESFVQYQWDNKRGLDKRFLAGANIRYNAWRGDAFDINAGLGLMYENELWNYSAVDSGKLPANASSIENNFIKINSYIRIDWKASETSNISFKVFLQTLPNSFKPRIAPNVQWNISAGKHFGFSINFNGIYDIAPVVPISNFYYSLSNSISYKI